MRRPAFQFYPADWRKDAELQSCSVTARGLWHEAMCIMHECEPYGELRVNGRPMTIAQLARLVGMTLAECKKAWGELEAAGVPSTTDDGAFYSRRMVKDEQVRNARAEGGKAGAEHGEKGAEHGSKGGRPRTERGDQNPPLNPPPSSSTSSSSSSTVLSLRDSIGDSKSKSPKERKVRRGVPDGFPFEPDLSWATDLWAKRGRTDLLAGMDDQAAQFRDHHQQHGKSMADWPAAWRTWARNALKFTRAPQQSAFPQAKILKVV